MRNYPAIGVQVPDIWLPAAEVDPTAWAVIACDQFTSQPDYWAQVENLVCDEPSTLHMILPEAYLDGPDMDGRTLSIHDRMWRYLSGGIVQPQEGLIYVERRVDGKTRRGLMLALDLELYDYNAGAQTLIRSTEGTMIERVLPRMSIRDGGMLELPHILVLIDDPARTVIEPLAQQSTRLPKLYDFDLMMGSGHLTGHLVTDRGLELGVIAALEDLIRPEEFAPKYDLPGQPAPFLFAMGDGNHSMATAKEIWEKGKKRRFGMDHPARYCLVEIENIHDDGLEFEPIHRVTFENREIVADALRDYFKSGYTYRACQSCQEMIDLVDQSPASSQVFGLITPEQFGLVALRDAPAALAVGSLQAFLDAYMQKGGAKKLDYVHGDRVVCELGRQAGNAGFYLPVFHKGDLFKTVILDGALPRKAFSMGEAHEKRFYMECRKIVA